MSAPTLPAATLEVLASLCDERPLVVFDLETTGTDRLSDRIVEIAAVKVSPDGTTHTFDRRVNPGIRIPREATEVHGISDQDVAQAPPFRAIAAEVANFFAGADLAGYNLRAFDLPLLAKEFERAKLPFSTEGRRVVDAQVIFFKKEPRDLASAVRLFAGREHTGAHSALADAIASAEVLAGELARYRDLPRSMDALHAFASPSSEGRFVDPDKRFAWRDGQAVFNFGEHRGKPLSDIAVRAPAYLEWILRSDFPEEAKRIARDALSGVFPIRG